MGMIGKNLDCTTFDFPMAKKNNLLTIDRKILGNF